MNTPSAAITCSVEGGTGSDSMSQCCGTCAPGTGNPVNDTGQDPIPGGARTGKKVGATAAAVATVAVACGVCCVVPLSIPAIGLGGFGAALAWFGAAHAAIRIVATALVLMGWAWVLRDAVMRAARPSAPTLWLMGVATLALAAAIAWPWLEPAIASALSPT
jgi:hypothetical protein